MPHFAVSAIGRDRPGIVAAIARVLLDVRGNVEDSQMSILRGHFAVMLIVSVPDEPAPEELERRLAPLRDELGLEAVAVNPIDDLHGGGAPATHVLSVYGSDHPGIVHSICAALAERGIDITDLQTRLTGAEGSPLYVMMMELALPEGADVEELRGALAEVGKAGAIEVSLRELEAEAL